MNSNRQKNRLEYQISAYEKIFDIVRVVDPIHNKTIIMKENKKIPNSVSFCFRGNKKKRCRSCISVKALNEQKTFTKIYCEEDTTFLMFATPIEYCNNKWILELVKYMENDFFVEMAWEDGERRFQNVLEEFNTLVMMDELTNVYNRRYIEKVLPEEIKKCSRKFPLSIAMVDIDYFKEVNDTYGHQIGDIAIKRFSQMISKAIRSDRDWVARYGGEEFLICLPNTDKEKAYIVLERIRKEIEKMKIKEKNQEIQITGSFGLCTIDSNKWRSSDLIQQADKRLYKAKRSGRNTIK